MRYTGHKIRPRSRPIHEDYPIDFYDERYKLIATPIDSNRPKFIDFDMKRKIFDLKEVKTPKTSSFSINEVTFLLAVQNILTDQVVQFLRKIHG